MGKEWSWGGAKSSRKGEERESGGDTTHTPSGCMCAMFQLFDFHHFHQLATIHQHHQQQPSSDQNSFLPPDQDPPIPKGAEAPRNSLELLEPSVTSTLKEDESLHIPMGIQIRTNGDSARSKSHDCSSSSEISSSPGTKTPNLVARLMGLDLLPDSPTITSLDAPNLPKRSRPRHRTRHGCSVDNADVAAGTRSLPETPRISSARRSVEVEHRLSLQINKENMSAGDEMMLSRINSLKRRDQVKIEEESSRSPGYYARQIVKQVKESVGRKVGLDITNTVKNRDEEKRNVELATQFRSKKISKILTKKVDVSSSSPVSQSCPPSLKFSEPKNEPIQNVVPSTPTTKDHTVCLSSPKLQLSATSHVNIILPQNSKPSTKPSLQNRPVSKRMTEERIGPPPRLKKPPQSSEPIFVRPAAPNAPADNRRCKKTPLVLSNDNLLPALLPVKKHPTPPATKIPPKQVANTAQESKRCTQLSSCSSQSYTTYVLFLRDNDSSNGAATTSAAAVPTTVAAEYYEYITRILKRTGIDKDTSVSSTTKWFSPSHPLDPSIFYYLELFTAKENYPNGQLRHRCNRKLLFQLVDEILVQILKRMRQDYRFCVKGSHLADMLCKKFRSFPRADCKVLEDIDGLIDRDLPKVMKVEREEGFEEEGEGIAREVEKEILEELVKETAAVFHETGEAFLRGQRTGNRAGTWGESLVT